jgi:hypothetical protein
MKVLGKWRSLPLKIDFLFISHVRLNLRYKKLEVLPLNHK